FTFNMVVLVLYNSGNNSRIFLFERIEIFIVIRDTNFIFSRNIFAYLGNTQTTFVKCPIFTLFCKNVCIDEYLFKFLLIGSILFIIIERTNIYNKQANRKTDLWSSQTHTSCIVHSFVHVCN